MRGNQPLSVDSKMVNTLARRSDEEIARLRLRESRILGSAKSAVVLPKGTASYNHNRNSRTFNAIDFSDLMGISNSALELNLASKAFKNLEGLTAEQMEFEAIHQNLQYTQLGASCRTPLYCPLITARYRTFDASCNNIQHQLWGSLMTPYSRLLPPAYSDGIWEPRVSVISGRQLKSPRLISTALFPDIDVPNYEYTLMLMQFGQFLSHDITQSMLTTFQNGSAISCCSSDGSEPLQSEFRHYACMPIEIPTDDVFYNNFGQKCMNFVRSVLAPNHECTLSYAHQMNKITSFIDGSTIYGSSLEQSRELRSFEGGQLRVFHDFGRDLLPLNPDMSACVTMEQGSPCFAAGDTRTNQMISLAVLHLVFMREHNRVAFELTRLNPQWTDEILFQEARRIIIAQLQVIVYKEFLPVIIGAEAMEEFNLRLAPAGTYSLTYDPNLDPSIPNEFASAAFRFGHSMVDGLLKVYGPKKMEEVIAIPEIMFHPSRLRKKLFLDELLSTLNTQPIQDVDTSVAEALTRYMFRAGNPFGVDLAAFNIQRGRDHGLRPYNDYRQLIGLPRIRDFREFRMDLVQQLSLVYDSVDDIDLWVGGLLEEKVAGALVGPTFRDIIADTFYRLKNSDRYFFQNGPDINPGFFTRKQLEELNKASLVRIVCDNSDGILLESLPLRTFRRPGTEDNPFVSCRGNEISRINLYYWQQEL